MIKKILLITIVIMLFLGLNIVYADGADYTLEDIADDAGTMIDKGQELAGDVLEVSEITSILLPLAKILTTIGVGVLLCVAALMGIKWLTANPEEQGKLKQQLIGLVVSAVVILGAYTIWSIALRIVGQF